jgi:alpha-N-arabinofuranosidase
MLNVHQGATSIPIELTTPNLALARQKIPAVSASASRDAQGKIHVSFANTDPDGPVTVACTITGAMPTQVTGRLLTAPSMTSHNTFDAPHTVEPVAFTGATLTGGNLSVVLPPLSVVVLEM